jgi:hypothetical protein
MLPFCCLQAKAIHVASCLETRRMVHALLFDKLLQHAGSEAAAAAAAGGLAGAGFPTGPLATVISNTMINSQGLLSSNSSSQNVEASPTAAATRNINTNSSTASNSAAPAQGGQFGWGVAGLGMSVGAVLLLVWSVAGKLMKVVFAVVLFAKDMALQLLMLRAVAATAKGLVASSNAGQLQVAPMLAAAGAAAVSGAAGGGLLTAGMSKRASPQPPAAAPVVMPGPQSHHLPQYAVLDQLAPAAEAAAARQSADSGMARQQQQQQGAAAAALGSLGLLCAKPLASRQHSSTAAAPADQQQRQQHVRLPLHAVQLAKLRSALRRKQRRQAAAVKGNDQLLYQLWAPEAARC